MIKNSIIVKSNLKFHFFTVLCLRNAINNFTIFKFEKIIDNIYFIKVDNIFSFTKFLIFNKIGIILAITSINSLVYLKFIKSNIINNVTFYKFLCSINKISLFNVIILKKLLLLVIFGLKKIFLNLFRL